MTLYTVRTSTMHSCAINTAFYGLIQTKRLGTSPFHPTHNVYAKAATDKQQEVKSLMLQAPHSLTQEVYHGYISVVTYYNPSLVTTRTMLEPASFFTDQSPPNERQPI